MCKEEKEEAETASCQVSWQQSAGRAPETPHTPRPLVKCLNGHGGRHSEWVRALGVAFGVRETAGTALCPTWRLLPLCSTLTGALATAARTPGPSE